MGKTEFIGLRVEKALHQSIIDVVNTNPEYKSITEFCNQSFHRLVGEVTTNQEHPMGHPDYPDLVKLVGSVDSRETQSFLYHQLENLQYNEVTAVYSWLKRKNGLN